MLRLLRLRWLLLQRLRLLLGFAMHFGTLGVYVIIYTRYVIATCITRNAVFGSGPLNGKSGLLNGRKSGQFNGKKERAASYRKYHDDAGRVAYTSPCPTSGVSLAPPAGTASCRAIL